MWAQLITTQLKPGKDAELGDLIEQLKASEQPGSGLVRSTAMRDQKDPNTVRYLVVFENEEKARARENDPARQQALAPIRALMAEIFAGPSEFVDLEVVSESVGQ